MPLRTVLILTLFNLETSFLLWLEQKPVVQHVGTCQCVLLNETLNKWNEERRRQEKSDDKG